MRNVARADLPQDLGPVTHAHYTQNGDAEYLEVRQCMDFAIKLLLQEITMEEGTVLGFKTGGETLWHRTSCKAA